MMRSELIPFNRSIFQWKDGLELIFSLFNARNKRQTLRIMEMLGTQNVLFTSSCRSALYLAYRALNLKGKVIVSPLTCDEAILPILFAGLQPEFADICPLTFNLCPTSVRQKIDNETTAIQAIYLGGNPSCASTLHNIALENNLVFIEDCAHALGARDQERLAGTWGDFGCFNFTKSLDGTGGALLGRTSQLLDEATVIQREWNYTSPLLIGYRVVRSLLSSSSSAFLSNHVYSLLMWLADKFTQSRLDPGFDQVNKKMPRPRLVEMCWSTQQISKLNYVIAERRAAADLLTSFLRTKIHGIQLQVHFKGAEGVYTRYYILVPSKTYQINQLLRKQGIDAKHLRQRHGELYQERFDKVAWLRPYIRIAELPNYQIVHDNLIALPLYVGLSEEDAQKITDALIYGLEYTSGPEFDGFKFMCKECNEAFYNDNFAKYFIA